MAIQNAWANVTAGASPTLNSGKNAASVTRNGVGDYTVNFTDDLTANSANYLALAGIVGQGASLDHIDVDQVNDRSVRVRINVDDALTDADFAVMVWSP